VTDIDSKQSSNFVVELKTIGQRGVLKTVEIDVGQRIKNTPITVELASGKIVNAVFRDMTVLSAPDPRLVRVYNSMFLRNLKVRASKFERVRAFFGGGPPPVETTEP